MKRFNEQSGQALVITALAITMLMGFVGLGVDMGMLRYQKRLQQNAADAAALAGASNLGIGGVQAGAVAAAAANGFNDSTSGGACADSTNTAVGTVIVMVCNHPADRSVNGITVPGGPHISDVPYLVGAVAPAADYVEAIVSVVQPTYFMKIFGVSSKTVIARAVATNFSGATQGTSPGCLYTLNKPSTTGINGVNAQGAAWLDATNCGVVDNGNYDPTGNSPNLKINTATFAVSGTNTGSNKLPTCSVTPNNCPAYGAPATADPLAGKIPAPTVGTPVAWNGIATPGTTYNGIDISGNGTVNFPPGVYVLSGGSFTCHGTPTITGTGVTFYFTNGATYACTGNDTTQFTAPNSGTYQDILFYQNPADLSAPSLGGNTGSFYSGILYFPTVEITYFGNNATTSGLLLLRRLRCRVAPMSLCRARPVYLHRCPQRLRWAKLPWWSSALMLAKHSLKSTDTYQKGSLQFQCGQTLLEMALLLPFSWRCSLA